MRLSTDEVQSRDKLAPCYHYYKPVAGQEYKGQNIKRIHFCKKCKTDGLLRPYYFWNGRGCQNCSSKKGQEQQFDNNEVLKRDSKALCAKIYPPDPNQIYRNQYQKRFHTCTICGYQGMLAPKLFWNGTGCPSCGAKKASKNKIKNAKASVSQKDMAAKAYKAYPSISEYKGVSVYRLHQCSVCNYVGKMKPDNFWHNGRGCPKCGIKLGSENKRANMKKIAPSRDKSSKYYSTYPPITEYTGAFEHRFHHCIVCGHNGPMTPNNFWRGRGCPVCADSGFDKSAPAILYYLRITTKSEPDLYKVGITNRTVKDRYNNIDLAMISVVKEWHYETGADAHKEEQQILKKFRAFLYQGEDVLQSGNNEVFTRDILKIDKG